MLSTRNTPSSQDPAVVGLSCVRKSLEETGISEQATTIMLKAWRQGTQKQYDTYLKEWALYCNSTGCDPLSAPLYVGINYLADLAGRVGYSAVNTARSALSSVITLRDGSSFGKHPMVKRLLKGVFEDKPSLPRYGKTWDLNVLLCFLRTLPEYDKISLKELTYKLVVLIAILSGQRCQTIHALSIEENCMSLEDDRCTFFISTLLKQSKPETHLKPIELRAYPPDPKLCVVLCLKAYLKVTASLRHNETALFITCQKPHKAAKKDTISRWIKTVLTLAGIDTKVYGAHSTRSASTSAAVRQGLPTITILQSAGWCSNNTFEKFYNMELEQPNFGDKLLANFNVD